MIDIQLTQSILRATIYKTKEDSRELEIHINPYLNLDPSYLVNWNPFWPKKLKIRSNRSSWKRLRSSGPLCMKEPLLLTYRKKSFCLLTK